MSSHGLTDVQQKLVDDLHVVMQAAVDLEGAQFMVDMMIGSILSASRTLGGPAMLIYILYQVQEQMLEMYEQQEDGTWAEKTPESSKGYH